MQVKTLVQSFAAALAFALACTLISIWAAGLSHADEAPRFAGSATCAGCHPSETSAWSHSDHSWALRVPTAENVLGVKAVHDHLVYVEPYTGTVIESPDEQT